jgi:hypothetical protein
LAERPSCKRQVSGSNPLTGSQVRGGLLRRSRRGVCDACDLCIEPAVVITGRVVTLSSSQAERAALSSTWELAHSPSGKVADLGPRLSAAYGMFELKLRMFARSAAGNYALWHALT